jgi:hypothetical protein
MISEGGSNMLFLKGELMATVIQHSKPTNQSDINLYDSTEMITVVIGFTLVILAFMGLIISDFMGLQLSPAHCWMLGATGILAIWGGLSAEENRERAFKVSLGLGILFLAHLVAGIMLPEAIKHRSIFNEDMVRKIAPGFLELKSWDHFLHGSLAVVFFIDAYLCKKKMKASRV